MGKSDIFEQLPENLRGFIAKSRAISGAPEQD